MTRDIIDIYINETPALRTRRLMEEVAQRHDVPVASLRGRSRLPKYVLARQETMFILRKQTHLSTPQIGRLLDRDHSSVLYGVKKHEARINGTRYDKTRNSQVQALHIAAE